MKEDKQGLSVQQLVSAVLLLVLLLSSVVAGLVLARFFVSQTVKDVPTSGAVNSSSSRTTSFAFNNGLPTGQARPIELTLTRNKDYSLFLQSEVGDRTRIYGVGTKTVLLEQVLRTGIGGVNPLQDDVLYFTNNSMFLNDSLVWQVGDGAKFIDIWVHEQTNELLMILQNSLGELELHLLTRTGVVTKLHNFGKLSSALKIKAVNAQASIIDLQAGDLCLNINLVTKQTALPDCTVEDVVVQTDLAGSKIIWGAQSVFVAGVRVIHTSVHKKNMLIWAETQATRESKFYLYNSGTKLLQEFMLPVTGAVSAAQLQDGLIYAVIYNGNTEQILYTSPAEIWQWSSSSSSSSGSSSSAASSASSAASSSTSSAASSSASSTSSASSATTSSSSTSASSSATTTANPIDELPGRTIWNNISPLECINELAGCQLKLLITNF